MSIIDGAAWATSVATSMGTGNVYWGYIEPENNNGMIAKKDGGTGEITREVVIPNIKNDQNHTEIGLVADKDGYIHFTGNHNNSAPVYYRSDNPEGITSWTFHGEDLPGKEITYQNFHRSNKGTIFLSYRNNIDVSRSWQQGVRGMHLIRYNTETKQWKALGGQNYCVTKRECNELCGEDLEMKLFAWNNSGAGNRQMFGGECNPLPCVGNNFYKMYMLRIEFDNNNKMHASWTEAADVYLEKGINPAEFFFKLQGESFVNITDQFALKNGGHLFLEQKGSYIRSQVQYRLLQFWQRSCS